MGLGDLAALLAHQRGDIVFISLQSSAKAAEYFRPIGTGIGTILAAPGVGKATEEAYLCVQQI
jgi:hypothetical protein